MDSSYSFALGTSSSILPKLSFRNVENRFYGEKNNNNGLCKRFGSDLGSKKFRNQKFKHGVVYAVATSDNPKKAMTVKTSMFERRKVDPQNVAAIILGGGNGAKLFPLTMRAATPAVPVGGCYRLIDIPMSNCINSCINKIFVLTQFNSASLNRHLARTYFGNGINFGGGFVEVLAATQTPGEAGKKWFQGTADAVRKFLWVFEDAKNRNIENILILSGDHLYRMNYMDFVQSHVDSNADITLSCAPVSESRASNFGLVKIDRGGRVIHFSEKPTGVDLKSMQTDTTMLGLSHQEATDSPYIASMGVYCFKTEALLNLLTRQYPSSNDFGSEVIPAAIRDHDVQGYIFRDYWEDIGTIKTFYEANLALVEERPKFEFYDPETPFYTSPRFLPPTKAEKCRMVDSIISHGCFLRECSVQRSIIGERSRLDYGVELQDTLMLGADYYQTESEIASLLAEGKVPIGIGKDTKIRKCIIDKNAKIGKNVIIMNKGDVQEADRPEEGFYIRSGITVIVEKATIQDGTVI
ncbi:putative glucose-1-phosphate adenylyltransferase [Arabidopsis thaliana]|jgi:glucose-1-phosphate adenylyltransferase|uniref:Probable glucose-1-phosphate adenylyltransferase large subunit, chloroplastic n=5 Tax=Arabidopsis TaxID=3701 RepID=GLGL4_ARATH|nr:Glucose-1-phosphate adenylyltransferase family protein [Arabidopsis thaliana]NP_001324978.1 Glucose-1-phosphate adenylyltransferase family protein [Arabidopsis thaliana]NP_001324979.1 Glucose-1-phosphate adenylyltransferase family protein [Arabidopsis thaliana]NP_001324980.1 Glucose-1-phosphate adenylyltransferase family protein [Arabidopsis thaliana]NP_001324981.1 Glucose-1-phosphate adenylyltransferase family protein [Arabidopsis thaliana]NP_001324982.1 Glucose-1-phosphate adenylyltransfe|eukprot:NP_001031391.1 Glucose-1-phosphate adenylyltransferase family protein [Arabidopsis thaliana]